MCDTTDRKTYPSPNMNTDKYIKKLVCAKARVVEAQNTMPIVTEIDFLRPTRSDIDPNRKAPIAIPKR